jgi:hypothetical protein
MSGHVQVGLGWLDGTVKSPEPGEVQRVIGDRFGEPFDAVPVGWYGKRAGYDGGRVGVSWMGRADASGTTRVDVTQTAFDGLGLAGSVALLRDLRGLGFRASRLDEWVDDYERRVTPERVRAAVLGAQAVTHARPGRWMVDDITGFTTYYLGRPDSDRMVRCYDRREPTRYELQSRREWAEHAASVVASASEPVAAVLGNLVSFADYRESRGRSDGRRAPRLDWWQAVVGDEAKAEGAPSRPRPSLEEVAWVFRRQWAPTFADLFEAFGEEWVNDVLREGFARRSEEVAS